MHTPNNMNFETAFLMSTVFFIAAVLPTYFYSIYLTGHKQAMLQKKANTKQISLESEHEK